MWIFIFIWPICIHMYIDSVFSIQWFGMVFLFILQWNSHFQTIFRFFVFHLLSITVNRLYEINIRMAQRLSNMPNEHIFEWNAPCKNWWKNHRKEELKESCAAKREEKTNISYWAIVRWGENNSKLLFGPPKPK